MAKLLWEAIQRSVTGPLMSEEKFETELFPTVLGDLQAKYQLEWDGESSVMTDPDVADALYQAGRELLLEVGLYCKNTRRIVKFTAEEIDEARRATEARETREALMNRQMQEEDL